MAVELTSPGKATTHSNTYGWYVVAILILAYTVSYVDRTILTLLVGPIRDSLQISDTKLSLLHGLAFALFYTVLGIPIARLADSHNRVTIITVGIVLWSLMTALCGFAKTWGQLFFARVGVGVGEATLSPAAYSILSDYFSGPALTRALSLYTSAIYIGAGLALMIGGGVIAMVPAVDLPVFGHFEPWQVVFLFVGIPGLAVAVLMKTVREPTRTGLYAGTSEGDVLRVRTVVNYVRERGQTYGLLIAGFSASALLWNGAMAWIPTFFIRTFDWSPGTVGFRFGGMLLIFGTMGIMFGASLSSWLQRRGRSDANLLVGVVSAIAIIPSGIVAPILDNGLASLAVFCPFIFAGSMPYGAAAAALQEITPNQMRAQITAFYFFFINLAGIGIGPTVVALITDVVFQNDLAVRYSLVAVTVIGASLSALLLWSARHSYRDCLAGVEF